MAILQGLAAGLNGPTIIQVEIDPRRIGRVKPMKAGDVGICGDAALATQSISGRLAAGAPLACEGTRADRLTRLQQHRAAWETEVTQMMEANQFAADAEPGRLVPRQALRELELRLQDTAYTDGAAAPSVQESEAGDCVRFLRSVDSDDLLGLRQFRRSPLRLSLGPILLQQLDCSRAASGVQ